MRPVPAEFSPAGRNRRSRLEVAAKEARALGKFLLPKVHNIEANQSEEDVFLLRHTFSSLVQWCLFAGDRFLERLLGQNLRPVYEYHRSLLQALQWQGPGGRWVLKTGQHLLALDVIADVFPDAVFIWTHRQPYELIPSLVSLVTCLRSGMQVLPLDLPDLAESCMRLTDTAFDRAMHSAIVTQEDRFLHVAYSRLVEDPVGTAAQICERLDLPLGPASVEEMQRWVTDNPQNRWGKHTYSLDPLGVDQDHISRRYAEYRSFASEIGVL